MPFLEPRKNLRTPWTRLNNTLIFYPLLPLIRETSELDSGLQWDEPEAPQDPDEIKNCTFSLVLHYVDSIFLDCCELVQASEGAG